MYQKCQYTLIGHSTETITIIPLPAAPGDVAFGGLSAEIHYGIATLQYNDADKDRTVLLWTFCRYNVTSADASNPAVKFADTVLFRGWNYMDYYAWVAYPDDPLHGTVTKTVANTFWHGHSIPPVGN